MKVLSFTTIAVSLLLLCRAAEAQVFDTVAPGSSFLCGQMPDGSNLIFTDKGNDRVLVSPKDAVAKVKAEVRANQNRIERLKDIKASLKSDGKLSASEARALRNFYFDSNSKDNVLPPSRKERREIIDQLINKYKTQNNFKAKEITAIRDCSEGKRPDTGTINLSYEVLKFKALDGLYITLIVRSPNTYKGKEASSRWYCLRDGSAAEFSKGTPRKLYSNPCIFGTPAFSGNNCSNLAGAFTLADFYANRIFKPASLWELDDAAVLEAEGAFRDTWAAGVKGRVRGKDGTDGDPATIADTCAEVP